MYASKRYGFDVTGVDIVPAAITAANKRAAETASVSSSIGQGDKENAINSTRAGSRTNRPGNKMSATQGQRSKTQSASRARFVEGSVFHMSFPTESFGLIIGESFCLAIDEFVSLAIDEFVSLVICESLVCFLVSSSV